ncbi:GAF domain-containing protein [Psychrosphaera sp. B3R10]|uniref:GAF domain-containing protein n=1 Tax=unclassified Psychrosphaera TaxID=2641570 RepID=UPI001C09C0C9|nr:MULTISPECIES: GAF domain-containing protein [unclassified Psychrosphaera]MBU2881277.1 GAF domain-containing protein [Psychrosphaera sp. I2R16]MBU2988376.1 GAF domain-containing protein [Psychrosphaera sp. B3R10]
MNKAEFYSEVNSQIKALCDSEPNLIANLANISAVLFERLADINWAGFYVVGDSVDKSRQELVLGPFQGRAACVRIPFGRGVCGTAVSTQQSMLVEDVHDFDGHIACDAASRSEVVVPIVVNDVVVAVLDIDSPIESRFDKDDQLGLESLVTFIEEIWA